MSQIAFAPTIQSSVKRRRRSQPANDESCAACGTAGSPAGAAFAAFNQLSQGCAAATSAVTAANFGPFSNTGSCTYDCGFMEQDWSWSYDPTTWIKTQNLLPGVALMNLASPFGSAFAPTQQWVATDLPRYAAALNADIQQILQIDAAIVQAGGTETPAQAQALATAFSDAATQLQNCLDEINGALQSLASFCSQQQGDVGYLPTLNTSCQKAVDQAIATGASNLINQLHCGGGDVQNQFNAMQAVIDASFVSLQPPFTTVDSEVSTALQAAAVLPGVFLNLQTDNQSATQELGTAQALPPVSPLRTLHLNNVLSDWAQLVSTAQSQLAT